MTKKQQNDYLENQPILLQDKRLVQKNTWSVRISAVGKFSELSFFVSAVAGALILLLEGGQVHHFWAKCLLFLLAFTLLFSLLFSAALTCGFDFLHRRFWKCPICGKSLPFLTIPRTFLAKRRSIQNQELKDLCDRKHLKCVRLPGSNLLIPSRCPHCGEKFWSHPTAGTSSHESLSSQERGKVS